MDKKKILVDLDVVTGVEWDKDKVSIGLINRIKKGEFELITPYIILELVGRWEYKELANRIISFFEMYSSQILTAKNVLERLDKLNVSDKKIISELKEHGIKEEDVVLALITSIFEIGCLVTNNRRHLRNKAKEINEVLEKNGLKKIDIVGPNEI